MVINGGKATPAKRAVSHSSTQKHCILPRVSFDTGAPQVRARANAVTGHFYDSPWSRYDRDEVVLVSRSRDPPAATMSSSSSSSSHDDHRAPVPAFGARSESAMGNEQRHDVLLTRLTPCTLLTMHYGGRLEAFGPSFILSPLKLGGPTRLRPSLSLALSPSRLLPTVSPFLSLLLPPPPSFSPRSQPFSLSLSAAVCSFAPSSRSSPSLSLLVFLVVAALSHT